MCALAPAVALSTASPGMKWSTPLPAGSAGTPKTGDQLVPLSEVLMTMSLALQACSNRQSSQATYTRPTASISADGSGEVRRFPATPWKTILEMIVVALQLAPPL